MKPPVKSPANDSPPQDVVHRGASVEWLKTRLGTVSKSVSKFVRWEDSGTGDSRKYVHRGNWSSVFPQVLASQHAACSTPTSASNNLRRLCEFRRWLKTDPRLYFGDKVVRGFLKRCGV